MWLDNKDELEGHYIGNMVYVKKDKDYDIVIEFAVIVAARIGFQKRYQNSV